MMKFCAALLVALLGTCLMSSQVSALPITYQFRGTVTVGLGSDILVGDAVSVSVTADAPPLFTFTNFAVYNASSFTALIGSRAYSLNPLVQGGVTVNDDSSDSVFLTGILDGSTAAGLVPFNMTLSLADVTATALTSVDLPASIALSSFGQRAGSMFFCASRSVAANNAQCMDGHPIEFSITSMNAIPAPEPAGLGLVMLGLASARWSKRRTLLSGVPVDTSCA